MNEISKSATGGAFPGTNFMTSKNRRYYKLAHGNGYAELGEGTGISDEPIFGVTVRPDSSKGKLFHSRAKALAYIESLS